MKKTGIIALIILTFSLNKVKALEFNPNQKITESYMNELVEIYDLQYGTKKILNHILIGLKQDNQYYLVSAKAYSNNITKNDNQIVINKGDYIHYFQDANYNWTYDLIKNVENIKINGNKVNLIYTNLNGYEYGKTSILINELTQNISLTTILTLIGGILLATLLTKERSCM